MAQKQEHRTKRGDRVRIKDDVTHMYQMARVYNEAIVKKITHDHLGYPAIYVEWDRDHWAYSGEEDGWVLEAHFDLVEEDMPDNNEEFIQGLADLLNQWQSNREPDKTPALDPRSDKPYDDSYEGLLAAAEKDAREGEAFIVIVAKTERSGGVELIAPRVYMDNKTSDAGLVCEAAMADLVAHSYARLISRVAKDENGQAGS
jgi:hypothetical protein